ncbi:hypothetical protein COB72_06655 [bacterium]|nr:MAG: hypothetical protein COB72_06655 [bacterium]
MSVDEDHHQTELLRSRVTLTYMRGAIVSLSIALIAGVLGVAYYIPALAPIIQKLGINFTSLRPIHTTFAVVFIILAGISVIHRYLEDVAPAIQPAERLRLRVQFVLWMIAGVGILVTLALGFFSGREYMGFHPIFSIPIILGWLLCCWNFFAHVRKGILCKPMHVTMWSIGLLFFIYTFIEQHAWLLPGIFANPIVDMQLQWKATGTLVGSFNLLVYGTLYYIATKISKNDSYAHCRLAYALFAVGLLNSFTNFAHHTYHLPQSTIVKQISFVISMTEIVLLTRVVWDIAAMVKAKKLSTPCSVQLFLTAAKWWTAFILATSIFISIPPINALIHGTTVVMGHAMGAEIGIDAMVLFAAITWILIERQEGKTTTPCNLDSNRFRNNIIGFNISVGALVVWLTTAGTITAVYRFEGLANPQWLTVSGPFIFFATGIASAYFLARLLWEWLKLLFKP